MENTRRGQEPKNWRVQAVEKIVDGGVGICAIIVFGIVGAASVYVDWKRSQSEDLRAKTEEEQMKTQNETLGIIMRTYTGQN